MRETSDQHVGRTQVHATVCLGADVTLGAGVHIGPGARLGDGVRVAPRVLIGSEATVLDSSVVVADVPALAVVGGNPATVRSYAHTAIAAIPAAKADTRPGEVKSSEYIRLLPEVREERGSLVVLQCGPNLSFEPRRCLLIYGVPPGGHRGNHAHRTLEELVVCVHGSCLVLLDDGRGRREVVLLDRPGVAAVIPPRVWTAQYGHSPDAVLMVLSSAKFDSQDYVDCYTEFLDLVQLG